MLLDAITVVVVVMMMMMMIVSAGMCRERIKRAAAIST